MEMKKKSMFNLIIFVILNLNHLHMASSSVTKSPSKEQTKYYKADSSIVVIPAMENKTAVMIFLHGLGDNGLSMIHVLAFMRRPYMKVISPTANITHPSPENPKEGLRSWFDYECNGDIENINKSTKYIHNLIEEEIKQGTPSDKIFLGGYSQGSTIAVHAARTFPERLAGVVTFEEWPLFNDTISATTIPNKHLPTIIMEVKSHFQGIADAPEHLQFKRFNGMLHVVPEYEVKKLWKFFDKNTGRK